MRNITNIVITLPHFWEKEADAITLMFQSGLERLHLRKPESKPEEVRKLLQAIPACYHSRIVIHEHFCLLKEFNLHGVHLNSRNPDAPQDWKGHISTSCHSISELAKKGTEGYRFADGSTRNYDYLSLSPIFNSISKQGYNAAFSEDELVKAKAEGIINERTVALGGICADNIKQALGYGFGGTMILGDAWKKQQLPIVLSIAGSDPSAGAGIQQDLKTITNCGGYGATVITAITSQNTMGVQDVMPLPAEVVATQLRSIFSDLRVDAIKIGMIPNVAVLNAICDIITEERSKRIIPIVLDPIMLSTSGRRLMSEECISTIVERLFPICTLITPNIPEYELLPSLHTDTSKLPASILIKGGHIEGSDMTDSLLLKDENISIPYTSKRIDTANLHGTGCTLSSAIASHLAQGASLASATKAAKYYMDKAILGGKDLTIGHGNGPLWYDATSRTIS